MVGNLEVLKRLGCECHVLYFSTEGRAHESCVRARLASLCASVQHGGARRSYADFGVATRVWHKVEFLVHGLLRHRGTRYPFSTRYDAMNAQATIVDAVERTGVGVVVLPSFLVHYAAALVPRGVAVIADAADVLTELAAKYLREYGEDLLHRWGLYANYVACRSQEALCMRDCSEIWATSDREAEIFRTLAPLARVIVVPNSLDETTIQPDVPVHQERVGFIGTFSYRPNADAAMFLAEQVFPRVVEGRPAARLWLAGGGMPEELTSRLCRLPYVDLLGYVPESAALFRESQVVAVPVSVGGGVPLKLVEAMARAKPTVVSGEVATGLPIRDGVDVLIRSGADETAAGIEALLADTAMAEILGLRARATFLEHWSQRRAMENLRAASLVAGAS
jgi:glycosyltransferase involved in cell wall biosynthesis